MAKHRERAEQIWQVTERFLMQKLLGARDRELIIFALGMAYRVEVDMMFESGETTRSDESNEG